MAEQHTPLIKKGGVAVGRGRNIDLIEGANVTLTVTETDHEVDVTIAATGAAGAPSDADYLVGTANAGLSAEIVVGTTPGGELGGTWASPTVDAVHSGTAHHAQVHDHSGAEGTVVTAGIGNDQVTYAKIQNISAASRLLGRGSAAGAGDAEEITLGAGLTMSGTELSSSAATPSFLTINRWSVD